jgi:glycosyltransferase involved in cell wall biosynthesis
MKICLATLRHEFRNSGEIESIVNLRDYLIKYGIAADILTSQGYYTASMPESKSGLHWRKALDFRRLYRVLLRYHRAYDIVHLFLPFPSFSLYGDFIKYKLGAKVVITFESCIVSPEGAGKASFYRYEPLSNLLRLCINNKLLAMLSFYAADAYTVSSRYQKKQLAREKMQVIPNLTNTKNFSKSDKFEAKKSLGLPGDAFVISYVGHLLEIKGVADLLRAFSELSRNDDTVRLAIAFSGIGRLDKFRALATELNIVDKVFFFGSVNVSVFISASNLLVLPYRYSFGTNWFPSILLEGFSVGVPIVTSDLAALRELNETREVLIFARAADYMHLASVISELMRDEKLESTVRNQRELMYTIFSPDVLAVKYIKLYETVQSEKN